jgi:hypothetical protein
MVPFDRGTLSSRKTRKTRASPASAGFPTNFKNDFGKTLA